MWTVSVQPAHCCRTPLMYHVLMSLAVAHHGHVMHVQGKYLSVWCAAKRIDQAS